MTAEDRQALQIHSLEYLEKARIAWEEGQSALAQAAAHVSMGLSLAILASLFLEKGDKI